MIKHDHTRNRLVIHIAAGERLRIDKDVGRHGHVRGAAVPDIQHRISNIFKPPIRLVINVNTRMVRIHGSVIWKNVCLGVAPSSAAIILILGVLGINPGSLRRLEIDGATPELRSLQDHTCHCIHTIGRVDLIERRSIFKLYIWNGGPGHDHDDQRLSIRGVPPASHMYNKAAATSMIMFMIIAILAITFSCGIIRKSLNKARYHQLERKLAERQRV